MLASPHFPYVELWHPVQQSEIHFGSWVPNSAPSCAAHPCTRLLEEGVEFNVITFITFIVIPPD